MTRLLPPVPAESLAWSLLTVRSVNLQLVTEYSAKHPHSAVHHQMQVFDSRLHGYSALLELHTQDRHSDKVTCWCYASARQ